MKTMDKRTKLSVALKGGAVAFAFIGVANSVIMSLITGDGVRSLLYFTLQSNILNIVVMAIFLADEILRHYGKSSLANPTLRTIKFVSLTSVMLTLIVFGFILTPVLPLIYVFSVTSITLHFIAPLLSLADYWVFDRGQATSISEIWYALVPPLGYFVFVLLATFIGLEFSSENPFVPYFFMDYRTLGWFRIDDNGIGVAYWGLFISLIVGALGWILCKIKQPKTKFKAREEEVNHDWE